MHKQYIDRNSEIAKKVISGATLESVAAEYELTPERARQITQRFTRIISHTSETPCDWHNMKEVRRTKGFWLGKIRNAAELMRVRSER